jgi:hydrogenase-4 component B
MEYTGTSLGQSLVSLFSVVLRPRNQRPASGAWHRASSHFQQTVPDFVLERLVMPVFRAIGRQVPRLRFLQQGQTQVYILYVFGMMMLLLGFAEWGGGHG